MARSLRIRAFQAWWRLARPMTLGVRGVVVDGGGKVLLVRHTYVAGWHFPGGGVEKAETAAHALGRELVEEAGIVLTEPALLVSIHANHGVFPNDHVLFYRAEGWTHGKASSRGEIAEIGFFDPKTPPDGTTGGTKRRLAELFEGAAPSHEW